MEKGRRSVRPEPTAEQREVVRRIRSQRQGSWVWRPLGLLLIAAAAAAALDPEYPVARPKSVLPSAVDGIDLLPRPLAPRGEVDAAPAAFRWTWAGPRDAEFDFVLLDEELEEVFRRSVRGHECPVDGNLGAQLAGAKGAQWHWSVVARCRGQERRSAPVAFGFSR